MDPVNQTSPITPTAAPVMPPISIPTPAPTVQEPLPPFASSDQTAVAVPVAATITPSVTDGVLPPFVPTQTPNPVVPGSLPPINPISESFTPAAPVVQDAPAAPVTPVVTPVVAQAPAVVAPVAQARSIEVLSPAESRTSFGDSQSGPVNPIVENPDEVKTII